MTLHRPDSLDHTIDEQCLRELVFALLDVAVPYFHNLPPQHFEAKVEAIFREARLRHGVEPQLGKIPTATEAARKLDREILVGVINSGFPAACDRCTGTRHGEPCVVVPLQVLSAFADALSPGGTPNAGQALHQEGDQAPGGLHGEG